MSGLEILMFIVKYYIDKNLIVMFLYVQYEYNVHHVKKKIPTVLQIPKYLITFQMLFFCKIKYFYVMHVQ